jgi:hypothetical protein
MATKINRVALPLLDDFAGVLLAARIEASAGTAIKDGTEGG